MLNVNRKVKIIVIPLIIFCIPNIAFPDKAFDVNGINIGDDYKKIKNQFNCRDITTKIGNKEWVYQLGCDNGVLINLDHEGRATSIYSEKIFSSEPDFQKIKNQLYSKYGEPDQLGHIIGGPENTTHKGYQKSFCWGSCKKSFEDSPYSKGDRVGGFAKGKSLTIEYSSFSEYGDEGSLYSIRFKLLDDDWRDREKKWLDNEYKIHQGKIKDQESDLHL